MTHITMDGANRDSNPGFAGRHVLALVMSMQSRYGRWRRYLMIEAELRQYSPGQLTELGIASADISRIAADEAVAGMECRREGEFRSALDRYIANYRRQHATRSGDGERRVPSI